MSTNFYAAAATHLLLATLLLGLTTPVCAAPLDFDNDGLTDRVAVTIDDNSSFSWEAVGEIAASDLGQVGEDEDSAIPGRWLANDESVVGFVRKVGFGLSWNILNGSALQSVTFGSSNGVFLSGGDYNGDGIIDAAVVTKNGSSREWNISSDLFTAETPTTTTIQLGRAKDIPLFLNVSGLSDSIAVLHTPPGGSLLIRALDITTNVVRRMRRIPRTMRKFGRPLPLAKADGTDVLAFIRKGTGITIVNVIALNGRRIKRIEFPEAVDVVVGNFLAAEGEEVGFVGTTKFEAINPFTSESSEFDPVSGVAAGEININQFTVEDYDGLPDPSDTCYEQDPTDGYKIRFIWKPKSDTQFGSVVILPGTYLNKISALKSTTSAGETIREFAFKGNANPDISGLRPHYIDRIMEGPAYRRRYGAIKIRVDLINGACLEYPIENPAVRVD